MSNYYQEAPQGKDPQVWEIAKRRASFKYHLAVYIVIIGAMWVFWAIRTGGDTSHPWPVWPTFGWGLGLLFHYLGAYVTPKENSVEKEYERMMKNK